MDTLTVAGIGVTFGAYAAFAPFGVFAVLALVISLFCTVWIGVDALKA